MIGNKKLIGLTGLLSASLSICVMSIAAQTPVERDQRAMAILTQTITAAGGSQALSSIQDFTETGTMTFNWGAQTEGSVTIKGRGPHEFRMDANLSSGQLSSVVKGDSGRLLNIDGSFLPILRQSASDNGSMTLPYVSLIAAIQDSSTSILFVGPASQNGTSVYDIRIQKVYTADQDQQGTRGAREARDFYIDSTTSLVDAISDQIHFGSGDIGVSHQILYSNYTTQYGIAVPMVISESTNNQMGYTVSVTQVVFNSSLTDDDFTW